MTSINTTLHLEASPELKDTSKTQKQQEVDIDTLLENFFNQSTDVFTKNISAKNSSFKAKAEYLEDEPVRIQPFPFTSKPLKQELEKTLTMQTVSSGLMGRWREFVSEQGVNLPADVNQLVQSVLTEAYQENSKDLYFYAEKIKFFNNVKKAIRKELTRAREAMVDAKQEILTQPCTKVQIDADFTNSTNVRVTQLTQEQQTRTADAAFKTAEFKGDWKVTDGRRWDPLAIDLNGDGSVTTIDKKQGVFDLSTRSENRQRRGRVGSMGVSQEDLNKLSMSSAGILADVNENRDSVTQFTEWFGAEEGILVFDRNANGNIEGEDLFGDKMVTGRNVRNGYEDLALLDTNADGKVDFNDNDFHKLRVWQDKNSDGIAQEDETKHLFEHRLVSLATHAQEGALQGENSKVIKEGSTSVQLENAIFTKAELETYIKKFEEELNSVGDDAQLANVDLQNWLQKQQQTLQMMSNISKMLHDTAMSVIRKVGG
jgi:hypothetical protein